MSTNYIYTKDCETVSSNIYFLNSRNFADSLDDTSISNAVPSMTLVSSELNAQTQLVANVSGELTTFITKICSDISTDLSGEISNRIAQIEKLSLDLSTDVQALSDNLSTDIDSLSIHLSNDISALSASLCTEIQTETANRITSIQKLSDDLSIDLRGLSTETSYLSTELKYADAYLSSKIDSKISVALGDDRPEVLSIDALTIHKMSRDRYRKLLANGEINPTDLYIVSSDTIDAYNNKVINVANATMATDAVNLSQLSSISNDINAKADSLSITTKLCIEQAIDEAEKFSAASCEVRLNHVSNDIMNEVYLVSNDVYSKISNDLYVDPIFVDKSGDSISWLSVDNGLSAHTLVVQTQNHETNPNEGQALIVSDDKPLQIYSNHTGIEFVVENSINNLSVISNDGKQSLSAIISSAIDAKATEVTNNVNGATDTKLAKLTADTNIATGHKITRIKQVDGQITVIDDPITPADIPNLPTSKITNLANEFYTALSANRTFAKINDLSIGLDSNNIILKVDGKEQARIDTTAFIKDGILETVDFIDGGTVDNVQYDGPHLIFKWNADSGKTVTAIALSSFINPYGIDGEGLELNGNKFSIDYDVVAKKSNVDAISGRLSNLSNDNIRNLYYAGHATLNDGYETLSDIINNTTIHRVADDADRSGFIKNNAMFNISIDEHDLSIDIEGVVFYQNDLMIVHRDEEDDQYLIPYHTITSKDIRLFHCGVTPADFADISNKIVELSAAAQADFVNVTGDTMTGPLIIGNDTINENINLEVHGQSQFYNEISVADDCAIYADEIDVNDLYANAIMTELIRVREPKDDNDHSTCGVQYSYKYVVERLNLFNSNSNVPLATSLTPMLRARGPIVDETEEPTAGEYIDILDIITELSSKLERNTLSVIHDVSTIVTYDIANKIWYNNSDDDETSSYLSACDLSIANIPDSLYDSINDSEESAFQPSVVYVPTNVATRKYVDNSISDCFEISIDNVLANLENASYLSDVISAVCEIRDVISSLVLRNNGIIKNIDE